MAYDYVRTPTMHHRHTLWTKMSRRTRTFFSSLFVSAHHGQPNAVPVRELLAREGAHELLALLA